MDEPTVLIAPDEFKGACSATTVSGALAAGLRDELPAGASVVQHPLADGGEGTVESIVGTLDGTLHRTTVRGPLGGSVEAHWGIVKYEGEPTAVIEMAAASGYDLVDPEEANPCRATTYGTGQLINEAIDRDVKRVLVGLGGSATVDGGLGMARALGFEFHDAAGNEITEPESLLNLSAVTDDRVTEDLDKLTVTVLSDVDNPLLGETGAARVYGPQKGADESMVERLESGLERWADVLEDYRGTTAREREGAGAAGGLGFGLAVLLNGNLQPGAQTVMDVTDFNSAAESADVLITGEGAIDRQTRHGKTPLAAARRARSQGTTSVVGICGQRGEGYDQLLEDFDVILSILDRPMGLEEALNQTPQLLESTGRDLGRLLMTF